MGGPIASPTLNPLMTTPRDFPTCRSGTESITSALQGGRGFSETRQREARADCSQTERPENCSAQPPARERKRETHVPNWSL